MFDVDVFIKSYNNGEERTDIDLSLADSHASLAILKLYKSKLLVQFINSELKIPNAQEFYNLYLYDVFHRKEAKPNRFLSFSNNIIFAFRDIFEPVSWFTPPSIPLPKPISFKKNILRTEKALYTEKTVGKILYERLAKSYPTFQTFADEYNITLANAKNLIQKAQFKRNGKVEYKYKTFVTRSIVKLFSKEIHPDYWYIFPEELSEEDKVYDLIYKNENYYLKLLSFGLSNKEKENDSVESCNEEIEKEFNVEKEFRKQFFENLKTIYNPYDASYNVIKNFKQNSPEHYKLLNQYLEQNNCNDKKGFEKFFLKLIGLRK